MRLVWVARVMQRPSKNWTLQAARCPYKILHLRIHRVSQRPSSIPSERPFERNRFSQSLTGLHALWRRDSLFLLRHRGAREYAHACIASVWSFSYHLHARSGGCFALSNLERFSDFRPDFSPHTPLASSANGAHQLSPTAQCLPHANQDAYVLPHVQSHGGAQ